MLRNLVSDDNGFRVLEWRRHGGGSDGEGEKSRQADVNLSAKYAPVPP